MDRYEYATGNTKYDLVADYSVGRTGKIHLLGAKMFKPGSMTYVGYWASKHMPSNVTKALLAHISKKEKLTKQRAKEEAALLKLLRR